MTMLSKQQMDAAQEFANATVAALKVKDGIDPETVVAATARMAGTYLFRSFALKLAGVMPGMPVLSAEANQQSSILIQIAGSVLSKIGIKLDDAYAGKALDAKHKPMLEFLDTQKKLESAYEPIKAKFGLSTSEAAQAAAVAAALLIRHCAKVLNPNIAFGIAVYGFIEGSKTAPEPVQIP